MSLSFRYRLSREDYLAWSQTVHKFQHADAIHHTYLVGLFWLFVLGVGAFAAYLAGAIALVLLFLAAGVGHIYGLFRFKSKYWQAVSRNLIVPKDEIELEIREDGLHEQSDGLISFAPWGAVTRFVDADQYLFIELSSRLWAIVPKSSMEGNGALRDFLHLLKTKTQLSEPTDSL